ncbi:hypothetical protein UPYG_G00174410 [Umbra pygmaea]|uniref:TNFR-Cys domain-containing protein n=1 Tax=Umbra pygmaea TaxID=75934 RepID=A0ABD0X8B9_UMBPY
MILFKFWMLICLCIFCCNKFLNPVEACKKGERRRQNKCEECPDSSFQDTPSESRHCSPCTSCKKDKGSEFKTPCLKTTDATCQCRSGFRPMDSASSMCKCHIGSGLDQSGNICQPCKDGFFTTTPDSKCVKWQECRNGVKIPGSNTSDVVCKNEAEFIHPTSTSGTIRTVSIQQTQGLTQQPTTQYVSTTQVQTQGSAVTPAPTTTTRSDVQSYNNVKTLIGVVLLFTILLIAVICSPVVIFCIKDYKKPTIKTAKDSLCRRPVEESGDSSLSSIVKSSALEEP